LSPLDFAEVEDYWEFRRDGDNGSGTPNQNLEEMHYRAYRRTELIESSPEAMTESVASGIGGGYSKCKT
jgi:hypothetical protein